MNCSIKVSKEAFFNSGASEIKTNGSPDFAITYPLTTISDLELLALISDIFLQDILFLYSSRETGYPL
jgi:hypothetical protein